MMANQTTHSSMIQPSQALLIAAFTYCLLFLCNQLLGYFAFELGLTTSNPWVLLSLTGSSLLIAYSYCLFLSHHYFKLQFLALLKFNWRWSLVAIFSGVVFAVAVHYASLYFVNEHAVSQLRDQSLHNIFSAGYLSAIAGLLLFVLLAPIAEEYLFRGLLYDSFSQKFGVFGAVLVSSLVFTGFHLLEYAGYWLALLAIGLLAVLLAILRYNSQSIIHSMLCHAVYNLTIISFGINP